MGGDWTYALVVGETTWELPEGESTVGRSRTSTVRLEDESVSRNHAVLDCRQGKARLTDLGSSNGTHVGDRRVSGEAVLLHGAVVRFGQVVARFEVSSLTTSSETTAPLTVPCGACGSRNPESLAACFNCGAPLPEVARACRWCDAEIPPGAPDCPRCGRPAPSRIVPGAAGSAPEPVAPPPPPPASPAAVEALPVDTGRRLSAAAVDALVVATIGLLLLLPVGILLGIRNTLGDAGRGRPETVLAVLLAILGGGALAACGAYLAGGWARSGATFGERLFHLRLEGPDGIGPLGWKRAVGRFLALLLAALPAGLGLAPVLFGRRGLHDLLSATRPVLVPPPPGGRDGA